MNNYFIFTKFENDIHMNYISEEILNNRLEEGYYSNYNVVKKIPKNTTKYWKLNDVLIIKGEMAVVNTTHKICETIKND